MPTAVSAHSVHHSNEREEDKSYEAGPDCKPQGLHMNQSSAREINIRLRRSLSPRNVMNAVATAAPVNPAAVTTPM